MDSLKQYLNDRTERLEKEKIKLAAAITQNQAEIQAISDKVGEIRERMDDAFRIFSPKPRNRDMERTEIAVLGEKAVELQVVLKANEKKLAALEQEQAQVRTYIEQLENGEVIARVSEDMGSVAHLYNRMKAERRNFYEFVVRELEPYEDKKNEAVFSEIREYRSGTVQYNHIISFTANLDLQISRLNKRYENRVGIVFENREISLSAFQQETMTEFLFFFSEELLKQREDIKFIIKVKCSEDLLIYEFNLNTSDEVDLEKVRNQKVTDGDDGLTVSDLLCLNNGSVRNLISRGQRQLRVQVSRNV